MPLYQYLCVNGHDFEEFNSVKERNNALCPVCKSVKVTKLISPIHFDKDTKFVDCTGEKIWWPKHGGSYYDKALRRTFNNIKEKKDFMDKHGLALDGSSDKPRHLIPQEAGPEQTGNRVTIKM